MSDDQETPDGTPEDKQGGDADSILQSLDPNMAPAPLSVYADKEGGPISFGDQSAFESAQPAPPAMSTQTETVSTFQYDFKQNGKLYRAFVKNSPSEGYSIDLKKFEGGGWVPSTSARLMNAMLGYFIAADAVQTANKAIQEQEALKPKKEPVKG